MSPADSQLLQRFVAERSEDAFEELVQRHGSMVLGVCERLLNDPHDAEDAFQAAFLVLARNAAKVRKSGSVASWLHGVALRVGLDAKRLCARRRERERQVAEMTVTRTESETAWRDLGPVLDEELGRLPERLRAPVVLCYLESKSTEDAARQLGWTHGALRGRLAKARDKLRGRLSRRGIVVGAALLAAVISERASAAAVSPACVACTVQAAAAVSAGGAIASAGLSAKVAALAEGALKGMFLAKVKAVAGASVAGAALLLGGAFVAWDLSRMSPAAMDEPAPDATPPRYAARPPVRVEPVGPSVRDSRRSPAQQVAPLAEPPRPADAPGAERAGRARGKKLLTVAAVTEDNVPEAVLQSLAAFRPDATIESVKRETEGGETVYKVDLEADGKGVEVELGEDGTIREVKEETDLGDIPQAVADAVAERYPQATVREAVKRTQGDETTFEVELDIDGEEFDVEVTPDGEVVEDERVDAQDEDGDEEGDEHEEEAADGAEHSGGEHGRGEEGDNAGPTGGAGPEVF